MKFAVPEDNGAKMIEKERQIPGFCQWTEKKKQWSMKVSLLPILVDGLETVYKDRENRLVKSEWWVSWPSLDYSTFKII